ncbi:site-2 protease family protein [Streptomyces sp. NPDC058947]|uniref:site-2 protease family protein n=1 Tax=Streptomyces sp. NPDC058947 TaxID=3346675 RepID=UPI00367B544E
MEESGGRGQPRSGNDESAEHHAGPPASPDERPVERRGFTPEHPDATPPPHTPAPGDADANAETSTTDAAVPEHKAAETPQGDAPPPGPAPEGSSKDDAAASGPVPTGTSKGDDAVSGPDPEGPTEGDDAEVGPAPAADAPPPRDGSRSSQPGGHSDGDAHSDRAYAGDPAHGSPADGPATAPRPSGPTAGRPGPDPRHAAPDVSDHRLRKPPAAPTDTPTPGPRPLAHSADGKGPAPQRPEPRGGLLMGRPFGVPVYVAPSWFLVAALITWVFGGQLERVLPELGATRYLVSLFFAVAFYASVLVHELAHTVAALRFKLPVRRIQLQFFGGVSEIEKEAETPGREFVLAFVGPLLSLALAGVFYAGLQAVEPGTVPGVLLAGLMISNLIVAAFNLLPGLPLDGGRMLRAVVWKLTGKPMTGTIAAAWVGRALAVSVLIGLPLLTQSGALGSDAVDNVGMDTVLDALLAAILAAIIWTGAGNSLRMARLREHLPELRARTLTRRAVPVESDTPLSEALRRANAAGARALVVVDADGQPLSLVREAAIVGVPEHRRPWVAVSGLAQELTDGMRVSAELSGEELLDALRATPATEYLVVEETGEIYGVLSAADVERAFVKAMARPS